MIVSINNVSSETLLNTVVLFHNRQNPTNVYLLRCFRCGNGLKQVQGSIGAIIAGFIPSPEVPTIDRCYSCHENYTFHTEGGQSQVTKLILSTAKTVSTFHCIICRMPLLQYNAKGVALLPTFMPITLPKWFTCFNPSCHVKPRYILEDIVEPVIA